MLQLLSGALWVIAGGSDLYLRKVPNWLFALLGLVGVFQLAQTPELWLIAGIGLLITIPAGVILTGYTSLGGADAKALWVLVLLFPLSWPYILLFAVLLSIPAVQLVDDVPFVSVLVGSIAVVTLV